ncbi:MAG: hypothetical protein HQK50_05655 [Oligoflexia bacterium]|nr:hypothetical protein [Oligoflexia bacterium]MBF0365035.1 hypothetical protein [Oligoflexia bacterium]
MKKAISLSVMCALITNVAIAAKDPIIKNENGTIVMETAADVKVITPNETFELRTEIQKLRNEIAQLKEDDKNNKEEMNKQLVPIKNDLIYVKGQVNGPFKRRPN